MVEKLLTKDYRQRPDIEQILRYDSMTEKMRMLGYSLVPIEQLKFKPKSGQERSSSSRASGAAKPNLPPASAA